MSGGGKKNGDQDRGRKPQAHDYCLPMRVADWDSVLPGLAFKCVQQSFFSLSVCVILE
jgi:hypothetical protein